MTMMEERRKGVADLMDIERTTLSAVSEVKQDVAVLKNDVSNIKDDMKKLVEVSRFRPVELLTYTLAGSTLTGIIAAWLSQFFGKH